MEIKERGGGAGEGSREYESEWQRFFLKEGPCWNRHAEEERLKLSSVKNHNTPFVLNKDLLFGLILILG